MVDNLGRWTPEPDYSTYPKEKWCDMDYVCNWLREESYMPTIDLEEFIDRLICEFTGHCYEADIKAYNKNYMINVSKLALFVEASGGLKEFDYEC